MNAVARVPAALLVPSRVFSVSDLKYARWYLSEFGDFSTIASLRESATRLAGFDRASATATSYGNMSIDEMKWRLHALQVQAAAPRRRLTPLQDAAREFLQATADEVYFARTSVADCIKIGRSHDACGRMAHLHFQAGDRVSLIVAVPGGSLRESQLHRRFRKYALGNEWFECAPELVELICSLGGHV